MSIHFTTLADRPDFAPSVAWWWFHEWSHLGLDHSLEEATAALRCNLNRDRLPVQVIAVSGEAVVGVAVLKPHEMEDRYPGLRGWLGSVYVAPEARGAGIAAELVSRIESLAVELGFERIHLQTQRVDGGGLYATLGWRPLERVRHHGIDTLVMYRELGSGVGG